MNEVHYPTAKSADVLLILEGTYPFIRGGVSSWVKQIIEGLPHIRFAIVFLGSTEADYPAGLRYELPSNLVHLEVHYLFSPTSEQTVTTCKGDKASFEQSKRFHETLRGCPNQSLPTAMNELDFYLNHTRSIDENQFYFSEESWNTITEMYQRYCTDTSFIEYFWTIRNLHRPLWTLIKLIQTLPAVKMFHTISTGYAGFLGALLHYHHKKPLMVTEHGIYTKERRIDLLQQQWSDHHGQPKNDPTQMSYQKQLWIRFFESLARMAYSAAIPIVSLFSEYQQQQIRDGADVERTIIIPNGVDLKALEPLALKRPDETPQIMCLIGRIVPIKDVKTFIRSVSVVVRHIPTIQAWIVGPSDESPEYLEECHNLVSSLNLNEHIVFKGMQRIEDILPIVGIFVLSSISEGLPLVILEAFAAGLPVVSTNVGACRELIEGRSEEDKSLGMAGTIVDIASPQALGEAVIPYLTDKKLWSDASQVAKTRVKRYYDLKQMINQYNDLYHTILQG